MYYIGLMAGTSLDGIDACIIDDSNKPIFSHYLQYNNNIQQHIKSLITNKHNLVDIAKLDTKLATLFAQASNELITNSGFTHKDISAIGSHGQTIYHLPKKYSWQLANPAILAAKTKIIVVANFRMSDIAVGGEGAPLSPVYHKYLLQSQDGIIVNLGGIANITINNNNLITGFDTGPANCLLDAWINKCQNKKYDKNGVWAKSGIVNNKLLQNLLADKYFAKKPPKSTGVEYFNLSWLNKHLSGNEPLEDVQQTLLTLSAKTICNNLITNKTVYLCGGGVHNNELITKIKKFATNNKITTTKDLGVSPDYLEAAAFAFFAKQTLAKKSSNIPSVTGAKKECILGGVYNYK